MRGGVSGGRGLLGRFAPAGLAARLRWSIVSTGAAVFLLIATLLNFGIASYARSLAEANSRGELMEARYRVDLLARELDAMAMGFSDWNTFYDQTKLLDPAFIGGEFDPWLADRTSASALVWAAADDTVLDSLGSKADTEALLRLGHEHPKGVRGPMMLPSGPAVVAVRPIVGDSRGQSAGTLAVARAMTGSGLKAAGLQGKVAEDDATGGSGAWRTVESPDGFTSTEVSVEDGLFLTRATLEGVDGRPALTLEVSRPDPWLGRGHAWVIIVNTLLLGIATIVVSYALATSLSRSVVRPLRRFVAYIQDQGYLALQGLRTDEELQIDSRLPEDFAQLGNVITDLMTQLRVNQSDLIEVGDQALAAERAFRTVVEESPEVKILVRGGVVEIANPAAARFFGLQLGDLLRAEPDGLFSGVQLLDENDRPLDLLDIARHAHDVPVVARVFASGQPDRWVELSVAFIDPLGSDYVLSARDITEERRLEALREEVLSLVSHDLRSPLTVVRGYIDILDKPLDDDRRSTAAESARRAATRMEGLLDDLLHATRAERVFAPKVLRPVDLSALVDGVASSLQMSAEQTIVSSTGQGVWVLGDPVRLEQAVTNLLGNAIKHGPAEGEIRVGTATRDGRAVVSIEDDGPGIPEDQREALFERGARGSGSHGTPGMGLGLYIVRVVAEAHGGAAYVDDAASGTRFILELPVMQPESETV